MPKEQTITKDQHDISLLQQSVNQHLEECSEYRAENKQIFQEIFKRVEKIERVFYIGLGFLIALQFIIPIALRFILNFDHS